MLESSCQRDCSERAKVRCSTWLIGLFIILADQFSKYLTVTYLPVQHHSFQTYPYGGIGVFKNFMGIEFSLNHMTNTGAAWGLLGDHQIPLMVFRICLIMGLLFYLSRSNPYPSWQIPFVMVIAGAASNVIDFFVYGHVIDMFHFVLWGYDFPVFNIADSAISVGIFLLFFLSWIHS